MTETFAISENTDAAKYEEDNAAETGLLLNGAKVVFDKEAALLPVNLQPKKNTRHDKEHSY